MKPFYTINELADLLNSKVYDVANGLVAADVPTLHNGKRVDLADYECFRPKYSGENSYVFTGSGPPSPNASTIIVSTAALPADWVQSIKEAESHDDEDVGEFKQTLAGDSEGGDKSPPVTDRAHVSNQLAILNQTASRFWANADKNDRSTHPIKADVVEWLTKHDFSPTLADHAATIIRPEWAGKGRKPEE